MQFFDIPSIIYFGCKFGWVISYLNKEYLLDAIKMAFSFIVLDLNMVRFLYKNFTNSWNSFKYYIYSFDSYKAAYLYLTHAP